MFTVSTTACLTGVHGCSRSRTASTICSAHASSLAAAAAAAAAVDGAALGTADVAAAADVVATAVVDVAATGADGAAPPTADSHELAVTPAAVVVDDDAAAVAAAAARCPSTASARGDGRRTNANAPVLPVPFCDCAMRFFCARRRDDERSVAA